MKSELATTAVAFSWTALFAAVWFNRHPQHLDPGRDAERAHAGTQPSGRRPRRSAGTGRHTEDSGAIPVGAGADSAPPIGGVGGIHWFELDLFPASSAKTGSRFDDTVAHPIDTPDRLDAAIRAAGLRLRALPEPKDLGHRTIAYRARLQQVMRDAAQARARLADGTYGACLACGDPISLALLSQRPWARSCIYCELDI